MQVILLLLGSGLGLWALFKFFISQKTGGGMAGAGVLALFGGLLIFLSVYSDQQASQNSTDAFIRSETLDIKLNQARARHDPPEVIKELEAQRDAMMDKSTQAYNSQQATEAKNQKLRQPLLDYVTDEINKLVVTDKKVNIAGPQQAQ